MKLVLTRGFRNEPFGAITLWIKGVRYRLTVAKWKPPN